MTAEPQRRAARAGEGLQTESSPLPWWVVALAIAVILAAHIVGRVGSFCSPIHADSYAYSCIGYRIAQGGVFYSPQLSDIKPPGLYHLYALAYLFLPPGRGSMIPFDSLFGLLGYWAVYLLAKDLYGSRIGLVVTVTAVLAINACAVWDFGTEAFGLAESFMVFPAAMAVRHYRRALTGQRVGWPMALAVGPRTGRLFVSPTSKEVGHPFMHFIWCGIWIGVELSIKQTTLPLVLFSGTLWSSLAALRRRLDARRAFACLSAAAVLSIAFGRIVVDTIVPIAISRYRTYDAAADHAFFDEMVSREVINFGVPPAGPPN